jgi:hypothetical protein
MRFKSKAQRRKFAELLVKGEISPEAFERWNRDTGRAKLPERAKAAAKRRKKSRTKPKNRAAAGRPSMKSRSKPKRKRRQ